MLRVILLHRNGSAQRLSNLLVNVWNQVGWAETGPIFCGRKLPATCSLLCNYVDSGISKVYSVSGAEGAASCGLLGNLTVNYSYMHQLPDFKGVRWTITGLCLVQILGVHFLASFLFCANPSILIGIDMRSYRMYNDDVPSFEIGIMNYFDASVHFQTSEIGRICAIWRHGLPVYFPAYSEHNACGTLCWMLCSHSHTIRIIRCFHWASMISLGIHAAEVFRYVSRNWRDQHSIVLLLKRITHQTRRELHSPPPNFHPSRVRQSLLWPS